MDDSENVDPIVPRRRYSTTTAATSSITAEPKPDRAKKTPKQSPRAQGRKNASRACVQCRKKKRRVRCPPCLGFPSPSTLFLGLENVLADLSYQCDGEDCLSCAREGIACLLDLDTDQRRQINRNNRNFRDRQSEKLLMALRCASLRDAESLFDAIRQNMPKSQLEVMVEQLGSPFKEGASASDDMRVAVIDIQALSYGCSDSWKPTPTDSKMSFTYDQIHTLNQERVRFRLPTEPGYDFHFGSATDIYTLSAYLKSDRFSQVMLSFREAASSLIAGGASTALILSMDGLDLDLFFRERIASDPHTVSTWACEMVKAYTDLTPVVQLALVYFAGTFMRWLILPCRGTYTLMSKMMRPFPAESMIHDAAEVEFCRHRGLKLLTRLIMNDQQHNWPYPYASCMASPGVPAFRRLSNCFMEHCDDAHNWEAISS